MSNQHVCSIRPSLHASSSSGISHASLGASSRRPDLHPCSLLIHCRYLKGRYVEYTDDTFTQKKARAPEDEYLGLVGESHDMHAAAGTTLKSI